MFVNLLVYVSPDDTESFFVVTSFDSTSTTNTANSVTTTGSGFRLNFEPPNGSFFAATQTPQPTGITDIVSGVFVLKYGIDGSLQPSASFNQPIELIIKAVVPVGVVSYYCYYN